VALVALQNEERCIFPRAPHSITLLLPLVRGLGLCSNLAAL